MSPSEPLTERYQRTTHIARGGMADVYAGYDTLLGRRVAVKVLHSQLSSDEAFVRRFRKEAQAAANLSHPNIVGIYDWGEADSEYFIVMELVEGRSLREILRSGGPLLPRRAMEIAADVASALSVAHRAGIVHRDIKPGNILIAPDGAVKVTDFGIARAWDDSAELTKTGAVIGTATYFSPEQAQGLPADTRSDLYSLGVVLYEMLTGMPPFKGDSPMAVAFQHVSQEPVPPSALNPDVPPALDAIVLRALRKEPGLRYQTADELRSDLLATLRGEGPPAAAEAATRIMTAAVPAVGAGTPTTPGPLPPAGPDDESRSNRRFAATVALLLLTLGVLGFLIYRLVAGPGTGTVPVPDVTNMLEADAVAILQEDGFQVELAEEPSADIEAGRVVRTDPPADTEAPEGSTVTIYTSTGPGDVAVPNVAGQPRDAAERILRDAGFDIGDVTTEPSSDVEEGAVIRTDPPAGLEVPAGTAVDLIVSEGAGEVTIPNLAGRQEADAVSELEERGLSVTVQTEPSAEVAEGRVIRTEPPAGTSVQEGDPVTVFVSTGPEEIPAPSLLGMTENDARATLGELGLVLRVSPERVEVSDPGLEGVIVEQNPEPNVPLVAGDSITVYLGEFTPPPTTTTTTTAAAAKPPPTGPPPPGK